MGLMVFLVRNEGFVCDQCGKSIAALSHGTYRNHCPKCLYSRHVDNEGPGDRASACGGLMEPVGLDQDGKKGFVIIHRCTKCGLERRNKAAPDDDLSGCFPQP